MQMNYENERRRIRHYLARQWRSEHRWPSPPVQWREVDFHLDSNSQTLKKKKKNNTDYLLKASFMSFYLTEQSLEMWWDVVFTWQRPFRQGQRSQVHILVSQTLKKKFHPCVKTLRPVLLSRHIYKSPGYVTNLLHAHQYSWKLSESWLYRKRTLTQVQTHNHWRENWTFTGSFTHLSLEMHHFKLRKAE